MSTQNPTSTFLLQEVSHLREENRKLKDKIASLEHQYRELEVNMKNEIAEAHEKSSEKSTAMISEIFKAQQLRDVATATRLRLANEEKEQAMRRIEMLELQLKSYTEKTQSANEEIIKLEEEHVTHDYRHGIDHVQTASAMPSSKETSNPEQFQLFIIEEQLKDALDERDQALNAYRCAQDELETLRVYYCLHKSLSNYTSFLQQDSSGIEQSLKSHIASLSDQLKQCLIEKYSLANEIEVLKSERDQAQNSADRFSHIVDVLRRKVNGGLT